MSEDLAEFLGIMVGDGHLGKYREPQNTIVICGNIRDKKYYENYVNDMILRLFNIKFNYTFQKSRNAILLRKNSKAIFYFLTEVIGLPTNRKDSIEIPNHILSDAKKIKISFLRGLVDADFCLIAKFKPNLYPVIQASFKSKRLVDQCSGLFNELGIKNSVQTERIYYSKRNKTYIGQRIYLNGWKRVEKYVNIVGFSKHHNNDKYEKTINMKRPRRDSNPRLTA